MSYYPPVGYSFAVGFFDTSLSSPSSILVNANQDHNFKEVSGLTSDISVTPYAEGGVLDFQHPLPSPPKHSNISLKRGLMTASPLSIWVQEAVEEFKISPKDLLITLLGPQGIPIVAWHIMHAYPVKWDISGFNAMENSLVVETIELVCRKHRRIPV